MTDRQPFRGLGPGGRGAGQHQPPPTPGRRASGHRSGSPPAKRATSSPSITPAATRPKTKPAAGVPFASRQTSTGLGPAPNERRRAVPIGAEQDTEMMEAPSAATSVELEITGMAYGGEAVGRMADGTVVFVWGAMPGERVMATITHRRRNFWRGQVAQIITASPDRITPACPLFGQCGGCQWQYMSYPAQIEAKQAILLDQIRPAYPEAAAHLLPPLTLAEPWGYRNIAHLIGDAAGQPAFRRWQSHELVAIEQCPISQPSINTALTRYQHDLAPGERLSLRCSADGHQLQAWRGDASAEADDQSARDPIDQARAPRGRAAVVGGQAPPSAARPAGVSDEGQPFVERIGSFSYRVSPHAFFQVNTKPERRPPASNQPLSDATTPPATDGPAAVGAVAAMGEARLSSLTEELVRLVLEGLDGYLDQTVVDAYCGVGLFALPLASRAPRVIGLDESAVAIDDALANAATAGLSNVLFLKGPAGALLSAIAEPLGAIVLDPPRTGVEEPVLQRIVERAVPRLVYVSCNPATLGRDLRYLAAGGYRLDSLRLVDLFPQTLHLEAVAVLTHL